MPLDLHVLGLPLAFILSQDQTLLCIFLVSLSSILGLRFLLRNQRSQICFRYFACTASSSLVNELPMSVRNRSRASFPLAPGPLWCPSFRTGLQRYCFFPNLQIFLNFFLIFFVQTDSQMTTIIPHHIVKCLNVSANVNRHRKNLLLQKEFPRHERISSRRKNLPIMNGLSD